MNILFFIYPVLLAVIFTVIQLKSRKLRVVFYLLYYLFTVFTETAVGYALYGLDTGGFTLAVLFCAGNTLAFALAITNSFFISKDYEQRFCDYQNRVLKKQMEEVNSIYMAMRGWRHDYHNHMQKIKAHIALKQYAEVAEYLDLLEQELDKVEIRYKTGNVSLDAILNSKLTVAEKMSIKMNCKVEALNGIEAISDIDLCALIGNLVDNAMEACEKLSEEERFIRIYICTKKKQLYISVANATNEVVRKLDSQYITSKRGNHGHGLKRISSAVEKYGGFINRKNEPGVFATEIMLPLK